jgi:hypothetical protein
MACSTLDIITPYQLPIGQHSFTAEGKILPQAPDSHLIIIGGIGGQQRHIWSFAILFESSFSNGLLGAREASQHT